MSWHANSDRSDEHSDRPARSRRDRHGIRRYARRRVEKARNPERAELLHSIRLSPTEAGRDGPADRVPCRPKPAPRAHDDRQSTRDEAPLVACEPPRGRHTPHRHPKTVARNEHLTPTGANPSRRRDACVTLSRASLPRPQAISCHRGLRPDDLVVTHTATSVLRRRIGGSVRRAPFRKAFARGSRHMRRGSSLRVCDAPALQAACRRVCRTARCLDIELYDRSHEEPKTPS